MKYLLILLIGFAAAAAQAKESILISLVNQQLYLYQDNKIIFSTPVSTGRESMATQPGHYVIDLKKLTIPDPKYHMTLPYFMRLGVNPPIGIHYAHNPGYPASHGCIRIGSMKSAITLYNLTPTGTEVTIL
jgi:lipoprotein-anchoring transpeptidase ErfK/SrfK